MEKAFISLFKSGSAVIYILILSLILFLPVLFIYQAFLPPVFTFGSVTAEENFTGDEIITEDAEKWQKVKLTFTATAGKLSPYSFEIREFQLVGEEREHIIALDEPVFCTKDMSDPFTITLYIKTADDVSKLLESVSLRATDYTKSFGEFDLKFEDGKARPFKK